METLKSQLTAEQPLRKKMLEPTKKIILLPKTKKKPWWDSRRGAIVIKWNCIHARWVNHKLENNYTPEIFQQEWKFWAPHQVPQPGGLATGGGAPRESGYEGQRGLITGFPQDWDKQKLHSWRKHTGSHAHQDPGKKAVTSLKTGPDLPVSIGGSPVEVGGGCGSQWGQGHCQWQHWYCAEYSLVWTLLEATIFSPRPGPNQQPVGSMAGMPQFKQPTGWQHGPKHQETSCLKSSWINSCLINTPPDMAQPTRGTRPAPPTSEQGPVLPTRKPAQAP